MKSTSSITDHPIREILRPGSAGHVMCVSRSGQSIVAGATRPCRPSHPRFERFGWASARFDDAVNLVPARLTALLAALLGDDPGAALRIWRRDAHKHPSPNAGPVESAFAGALGVMLGGVNVYHGRVEDRGTLGDGPHPVPVDIGRTARLAARVGAGALAVAVAAALAAGPRGR